MRNGTRLLIGILAVLALSVLAGIAATSSDNTAAAAAVETTSTASLPDDSTELYGDYAQGVVEIVLGETVAISGGGAVAEGGTVSITAAGVYHVSGTLTDGRIEVDAKGKVYLEFDGVDITSSSGPALSIIDAKKVTLTLTEGSANYLADAACDGVEDAALFTNDTLVINGGGTLVVRGNNAEGISSDDDIIINSGTIRVTAVDDGLNAHDDVTFNGGEVYIIAGGDGIDSNGTINVNGGALRSFGGAAPGGGGLDAIGAVAINGGTVIATGNSISLPGRDSGQCSIYVAAGSTVTAGAAVRIEKDGEEMLTVTPDEQWQNLLVSSGALVTDAIYQIHVDGVATVLSVTAAAAPANTAAVGAAGAE
ncbi:MAG: carbohydrate-binding domain-containing protein [Thermoleophilia bacterium]|nr:carbohydrate-binding domain-containing protein [Thermoleophilia bacterium]